MPYLASQPQQWASSTVESSHSEALFSYGELALFVLMWRTVDFDAGLVSHCTVCFGGAQSRQAAAFDQATQNRCPSCFGSTYDGGYRAQVKRPILMADRNSEITERERGVVSTDSINFETTGNITVHNGDYLFRFDGSRYRCDEKNEVIVRTGFVGPDGVDTISGTSVAHLESSTSVAYLIPPTESALKTMLNTSSPFMVSDLTVGDVVRTNGYV